MEQRLDLNGIDFTEGYVAVIDKPLRWTSADVVRKIKFTLNKKGYKKIKVGHAGTLDPLATGVLIVCIGRATKMVDTFQAEEKEYTASLELGATTPSFDMEHPVDRRYPYVYSAKKIDGVRAYEMARAGEEAPVRKSLINIYELEMTRFELPYMDIRVRCSRGTYIRSLAAEIGEELHSGAYLTALRRTRSGGFRVEDALNLDFFLEKLSQCETKSGK